MSFQELPGSPQEALSESSGSTASRNFIVPWENRLTIAQALVGTGHPNFPQCRINSIALKPFDDQLCPNAAVIADPSLQTADYSRLDGKPACLLTASYGPDFTQKTWPTDMAKPTIRSGTELRFRVAGSAQFLVLPFGGCKWQDNDEDLKELDNSRVLIPIREIELQWDFVDDPPLNSLDALMGTVNSVIYLGCEPETLLFENYSVEETFRAAPLNPHTNRVTINLRKRRIKDGASIRGWNHDYREEPAGWAKVVFKSDGSSRYQTSSFANMLS